MLNETLVTTITSFVFFVSLLAAEVRLLVAHLLLQFVNFNI
jgi:hypothetical protein